MCCSQQSMLLEDCKKIRKNVALQVHGYGAHFRKQHLGMNSQKKFQSIYCCVHLVCSYVIQLSGKVEGMSLSQIVVQNVRTFLCVACSETEVLRC